MDSVTISPAHPSDRSLLVHKRTRPIDRLGNVLRFQCGDDADFLCLAPGIAAYDGKLPTIEVVAEQKKYGALFFPLQDKPVRGSLPVLLQNVEWNNILVDERVLPLIPKAKRLLAGATAEMRRRVFKPPFRGEPVLAPVLEAQGYFSSSLSFDDTTAVFSIVHQKPGRDRRLGQLVCWCSIKPPDLAVAFFPCEFGRAKKLLGPIKALLSGGTSAILSAAALEHIRVRILTKCLAM